MLENNKLISEIKADLQKRVEEKVIEKTNYDLLIKMIDKASSIDEAVMMAELGTTYKRTGFHFDKRLEKLTNTIKYFKKNEKLSFAQKNKNGITHKLIIGDNYPALLNLLIEYREKVDVIYIDPPYGKDSMGEFAKTNYDNAITRDNLLSMLYPRLLLAKQLLSPNGVILCSIDDRNQAYVKGLFDDIFEEHSFLFDIPRLTKKGGKSTNTIAINHDSVLCYAMNPISFSQVEKEDDYMKKYKYEDEFIDTRGKYALSQTLDYSSLQYSKNMDFEILIDGETYIAGGNREARDERLKGNHGTTDWVWRWSKNAVEWGIKEKAFVIKNGRIYTKSYCKVRKAKGKNEWENIDAVKSYTTLDFVNNKYSNDNAKKELDLIFGKDNRLFKNPKPSSLIADLIKMVNVGEDAIILDFFAGSGTTGQSVLELNKEDEGHRQFILATNNEITDVNPNGIALDVTSKRLKRIMTGECYDGNKNFPWIEKNSPLGDNLDVYNIKEVSTFEAGNGNTPFDVIDETLYGKQKFMSKKEKVEWVCKNFEITTKELGEK